MKEINNIYDIKNSRIRIFSLQTKNQYYIMVPDLNSSYLLSLLIDKIWFQLNQFEIDYIFPFNKYSTNLVNNLDSYDEDYFIFYIENICHSNDYAFWFIHFILDRIKKKKKLTKVIIHSLKMEKKEIQELFKKFDSLLSIVSTDLELFFNEIFFKKTDLKDIPNISYRADNWDVFINKKEVIKEDLNEYIKGAYYNGYYSKFKPSKDYIISLLPEDDVYTDKKMHYRRPKEMMINSIRNNDESKALLLTSRWCMYNCSYCFRWKRYSKVRQISLESIKKDLDYLSELQYSTVDFQDDCFFTNNINRFDELIELLWKYNFSYKVSIRFESCTSERLMQISKLNISRMQIWLQSVSKSANTEAKRGFDEEKFRNTLKYINDLWIKISLDIILWLPSDGLKWFIRTFNFALKLRPRTICVNSLFLSPWTDLYKKKDAYGIVCTGEDINENFFSVPYMFYSKSFSIKDLELARKYVSRFVGRYDNLGVILR